MHPTKEKIALLNDKARKGLLPGSTKVLLTREVTALPEDVPSFVAELGGWHPK
jgi:hypothetical protein